MTEIFDRFGRGIVVIVFFIILLCLIFFACIIFFSMQTEAVTAIAILT